MRIGQFRVSIPLFEQLLKLPATTHIQSVEYDELSHSVIVTAYDPAFPDTNGYTQVMPIYTEKVEFEWGMPT